MTRSPPALQPEWQVPSRTQALSFWLRSRLLRLAHTARGPRARRWSARDTLADAPIIAQSRTRLWSDDDEREFILTAGKVHNLRVAARAFDGVVVPAGETLSFWRQLGRPSLRRGFVRGREVREGCLIPTVAGGICQLSNALATCALRAGFELVERHAHSAKPERGEGASASIDATVFWNYVDLRIRAPVEWRLDVELDASELIVGVRAAHAASRVIPARVHPEQAQPSRRAFATMRTCLGCDEHTCFRHVQHANVPLAREAWLLDVRTPEFMRVLREREAAADVMVPLGAREFRHPLRVDGAWNELAGAKRTIARAAWASARRIAWQRMWATHAGRRQASILDGQRWLAAAHAQRLRPEHTHLVVDQSLLPTLQRLGVLGGRSYDVLASALPMREIERRLDLASTHAAHDTAARATLADFRVDAALAQAELEATARARRVITAHSDVARYWRMHGGVDVECVSWTLPTPPQRDVSTRRDEQTPLIVFPASALARKGAHVLAQALRGVPCRLRVLGTRSDDASLWHGIDVEHAGYASDWIARADIVVLPAWVEHAPRAALLAVAARIPVIATAACGIDDLPGVTVVDAGDVDALREAVLRTFASTRVSEACRSA
jgi:glycosyltransferase involved in cell wall biosynthesis